MADRFGAAFSESNVRIAKIAQMAREAMDRFISSTKMAGRSFVIIMVATENGHLMDRGRQKPQQLRTL